MQYNKKWTHTDETDQEIQVRTTTNVSRKKKPSKPSKPFRPSKPSKANVDCMKAIVLCCNPGTTRLPRRLVTGELGEE